MPDLLKSLFGSRTRAGLLKLLLEEGVAASESELARRCNLSPRAVGVEVDKLADVGLVEVEAFGSAHVVRANREHPAFQPLLSLLRLSKSEPRDQELQALRESLVAFGAPFAGVEGRAHTPLEETLLDALLAARKDGTILRVLPVVLAKNRLKVQWQRLLEAAKKRRLRAELGMLLDLTSNLLGDRALYEKAQCLRDRRYKTARVLPEAHTRFEEQLAREYSLDVARRWGLLVNMSEDSFKSVLDKHLA